MRNVAKKQWFCCSKTFPSQVKKEWRWTAMNSMCIPPHALSTKCAIPYVYSCAATVQWLQMLSRKGEQGNMHKMTFLKERGGREEEEVAAT